MTLRIAPSRRITRNGPNPGYDRQPDRVDVRKIRVRFGVVPDMTPTRVINLSRNVDRMILDHTGQLHGVREITDENGFLPIPPPEATEPGSGGS